MLAQSNSFFPFIDIFNKRISHHFDDLVHEGFFNQLIEQEFQYLKNSRIYLDYSKSALYPESLVRDHASHLLSVNQINNRTAVDEARKCVLEYFNAPDYYCFFTNGLQDSLQQIGNSYPFKGLSRALMVDDNQDSYSRLNTILQEKVQVSHSILRRDYLIDRAYLYKELEKCESKNNLFVLPAQSHTTGIKHDLGLIKEANNRGWDVFLDVDDYVASSKLDLSVCQPDFVGFSFHKMFGYPANIGCLLVHKSQLDVKPEFKENLECILKAENENAVSISAIKHGLQFMNEIGVKRIEGRCASLRNYLLRSLSRLKHDSGYAQVKFPVDLYSIDTGATILLKLFDKAGKPIEISKIKEKLTAASISVGTEDHQCWATKKYLQVISNELEGSSFMQEAIVHNDLVIQQNELKDTVKISVGIATRKQDLDAIVEFIKSFQNL